MIAQLRKLLAPTVLLLGFLVPASSLLAQNPEQVYITTVSGEILGVDCNGNVNSTIPSAGSNLKGLFVRDDVVIFVAEHNQNGSVKMFNGAGTGSAIVSAHIDYPYAVTGDADGNLYVVTRHPGAGGDEVWRIPRDLGACPRSANPFGCTNGGYGSSNFVDSAVDGSSELADVKFVPSGAFSGNIFVLSVSPPMVVRYANPLTCSSDCPPTTVISSTQLAGRQPEGLTLADNGNVLVATASGTIEEFDIADGHFVGLVRSGLGTLQGIAGGIQGDDSRLFVTVHPGTFQCLSSTGGDVGTPVTGIQPPTGVGIASSNAAPIISGTPLNIGPGMMSTYTGAGAGRAGAFCNSYDDPRPPYNPSGSNPELFLCVHPTDSECANPGEFGLDLGIRNRLPSYARGFRRRNPGDPVSPYSAFTGPETIRICTVVTAGPFQATELTVDQADETAWLSYDPHDLDFTSQLYYTEEQPALLQPEGRVAINNTSFHGSDGEDRWGDSVLSLAMDEKRLINGPKKAVCKGKVNAKDGILEWQFFNECQRVNSSAFASVPNIRTLKSLLNSSITKYNNGDYASAHQKICEFESSADNYATSTIEIRGRAKAIKYQLCRLLGLATGRDDACITCQ